MLKDRLKELRIEKGLRQVDVANAVGVTALSAIMKPAHANPRSKCL